MSNRASDWAWSSGADVDGKTFVVLLKMADNANEQDECFPSVDYLARKSKCNRATVYRALNELVALGYIMKISRGGGTRSNRYRLLINRADKMAPLLPDHADDLAAPDPDPSLFDPVDNQGSHHATGRTHATNSRTRATEGSHPCDPNHHVTVNESVRASSVDNSWPLDPAETLAALYRRRGGEPS